MDNGIEREEYADMAWPRHESEGEAHSQEVGHELGPDGHGEGGENHRAEIDKAGNEEVAPIDEVEDASVERRAEFLASRYWSGMLPPPEEFNLYPKEVQDKIVAWADRSAETNDSVVRKAVELDDAESRRLDKAVDADVKQIPRAQFGTIFLNSLIVFGAIVCGVTGNTAACGFLVGGLATINVATLFVGRNSKRSTEKNKKG